MTEILQAGSSISSISEYEASHRNMDRMAEILSTETGIPIANIVVARAAWLQAAGNKKFSTDTFTH